MSIRISFAGILLAVASCLQTAPVRAYDTYVMHPALSRAVAAAYDASHPSAPLSPDRIEWLAAGSSREDEPALRVLNHFYNPQTGGGLRVAGIELGWASPLWAVSSKRQAGRFSDGDCSWERALREYAAGSEAFAFICLGQVLHLLEDASVPAHTRDDPHLEGDPYEQWLKFQAPPAVMPAAHFQPDCAAAADCIRDLARWIHEGFVSQDTISGTSWHLPWEAAEVRSGYLMLGQRRLAAYDAKRRRFWLPESLQAEYWQAISPMMIAYGRRLIELFLTEAQAGQSEPAADRAPHPQTSADRTAERAQVRDSAVIPRGGKDEVSPAQAVTLPAPKGAGAGEHAVASAEESGAAHEPLWEKAQAALAPLTAVVQSLRAGLFLGGGASGSGSLTPTAAGTDPTGETGSEPVSEAAPEPETFISERPASRTRSREAIFRFVSDRPEAVFECDIDKSGWQACAAALTISDLAEGGHTLAVRALAGGKRDGSPLEYDWIVDTTAPFSLLFAWTSGDGRQASFHFISETDATFACQLDEGVWQECHSPQEYDGLTSGAHIFRVRASDEVGNQEVLPSAHTWSVRLITPPPAIIFPAAEPYYTNDPQAVLQASTCAACGLLVDGGTADTELVEGVWRAPRHLSAGRNSFSLAAQQGTERSEERRLELVLDTSKPLATISGVTASDQGWQVAWEGSDDYGIVSYDVEYRLADGDWRSWRESTADTAAGLSRTETGAAAGASLKFRVRAHDKAGNRGEWSAEMGAAAAETEGPAYLWHLDECFGDTADSISGERFSLPAAWSLGAYGCGLSQGWAGNEQTYWTLARPIAGPELTLAFRLKAPFGSAGHIWLFDATGALAAGAWPTAPQVRVAANGASIAMAAPPSDQWTQVLITYSQAHLQWYIDGQLVRSIDGDFRLHDQIVALGIGQENWPWQVDEIALWPRAVSDAEAAELAAGQAAPQTLRPPQSAATLLHYWDFDEISGAASDRSGTAAIPAVFRNAGWRGQAMYTFWRPQYHVSIPLPPLDSQDISLSYWRRNGPEGGGGNGKVLLSSRSSNNGSVFGLSGGLSRTYAFQSQGYSDLGPTLPGDDAWHHIALVYDSYAYELRYYIDGQLKALRPAIWRQHALDWLSVDEDQGFFSVDDLKIWQGALSPAQVAALAAERPDGL